MFGNPQRLESRVHHKLDSIADYHRLGMRGWEQAQQERCRRAAQQAGRILEGQWPPKTTWPVAPIKRKDPVFETTEAGVDESLEETVEAQTDESLEETESLEEIESWEETESLEEIDSLMEAQIDEFMGEIMEARVDEFLGR
jgi:hypothetical protein